MYNKVEICGVNTATLKVLTYDRSNAELGKLLLDAMVEGNGRQADSLRAKFNEEKDWQSAVRTAVKERFKTGEIDYDTAIEYLIDYGGTEKDDAFWKVEEWKRKEEPGEDFGKYNEFLDAVQTGKNLKKVITKYTDNGVELDDLSRQISAHFKPIYSEMSVTKMASLKGYLLNAYVLCGVGKKDAEAKLASWQYEADHPELAEKITYSQYSNWETYGKPNGVSVSVFADVAEFRSGGETGDVRSQEEVRKYIERVAKNSKTRHALWCCFYKETTSPWR